MKKIKLFCIPYAGGSTIIYYKWKKYLDDAIELIPVELSGRGMRYNEPLYNTFDEAVEDVFNFVQKNLDRSAYVLFGHSMGSWIAYELCCKMKAMGLMEPVHLLLSGRWSPTIIKENQVDYRLPDDELKKGILDMGGTPEKLLDNEEMLRAFIPVFRSDFKILENYEYIPKEEKLNTYITVMTGIKDDDINQNDLFEWCDLTNGKFSINKFRGGHFFIIDSMEAVVSQINRILIDYL